MHANVRMKFIIANVDIASTGIEGCENSAARFAAAGNGFEHGNCHDGLLQRFGQRFDGGEADAESGKGSGARGYGKCVQIILYASVFFEQERNLGNELSRKRATSQGHGFEDDATFTGTGAALCECDAALFPRGICGK